METDQLHHPKHSVFHSQSIPSLWVRYAVVMVSNIIFMLMTPNCMYLFKVGGAVELLESPRRIEMCITEIKAWMEMVMLKTRISHHSATLVSSAQ